MTEFSDRESDALLALREAVRRLKQEGQSDSEVLRDLLGHEECDEDDVRILLLDSSMFIAWSQKTLASQEEREAELAVMMAEREAEWKAEEEAAEAEMAKPIETPVPNYDAVMAKLAEDEDAYPHTKVSIKWPDSAGESVWAWDLGGGLAMLDNSPLYPKYQLHDIIRFSGQYAGEVVHRPFPIKLVYSYTPLDDEEQDKIRRGVLADSVKPLNANPSFFSPGQAFVLLREGVDPADIRTALIETGIPITEVAIQSFDVETDEYKYLYLHREGGQSDTDSE